MGRTGGCRWLYGTTSAPPLSGPLVGPSHRSQRTGHLVPYPIPGVVETGVRPDLISFRRPLPVSSLTLLYVLPIRSSPPRSPLLSFDFLRLLSPPLLSVLFLSSCVHKLRDGTVPFQTLDPGQSVRLGAEGVDFSSTVTGDVTTLPHFPSNVWYHGVFYYTT